MRQPSVQLVAVVVFAGWCAQCSGSVGPDEYRAVPLYDKGDIERLLESAIDDRATCGPVALAVALEILGHQVNIDDLAICIGMNAQGVQVADLALVAQQFVPSARVVRDRIQLNRIAVPAILVLDGHHAVTLVGVSADGQRCLVVDGTKRQLDELTSEVLMREWTGTAIVFDDRSGTTKEFLSFGLLCGSIAVFLLASVK